MDTMGSPLPLGAFRLIRPIAQGGMGQVWVGDHPQTGIPVTIKVITGERARNPYFLRTFRNEIRAVAGLDHPGVVLVLDHGEIGPDGLGPLAPGSPYLVMEYASGGSLRHAYKRVMSWPELRTVLGGLLNILAYTHARGVIHRDLKPGNVLVSSSEDIRPGLKLSDFGLARLVDDVDAGGELEHVRGTLHFMSPEQCRGRWRDQGPWTDLYALGIMAYLFACGRVPFKGRTGQELLHAHVHREPPPLPPRRGLPKGFDGWVSSLLQKNPSARFQHAADAAWALAHLPDPEDIGPTRWVFPDLARAVGLPDDVTTDPTPRPPIELDPHEHVTVLAQRATDPPPETEAPTLRTRYPALPKTWRQPLAPAPDIRLLDAGLSLFGLRPVAMVGRQAERDVLWRDLRDVEQRREVRCAILRGVTGTGISRLATWMSQRSAELGSARVLLATHDINDPPLRPLQRLVARMMRCGGLDQEHAHQRVQQFCQRLGIDGDARALTDFIYSKDGPRVPLSERYALIQRVLTRLAAERPLILQVEDLQWGGTTVGLIRHLLDARLQHQLPLLVVAAARLGPEASLVDERIAALSDHPRTRILEPGPLSPADLMSLLHRRMGLSSALSLQVQERCGGNPLYAVQLMGNLVQQGLLLPGDDGFDLREGVQVELPYDLHVAWLRRAHGCLEGLPERARTQLELAATIGEVVEFDSWARVCAIDDPADGPHIRTRLLESLLDTRLALRTRRGWRFIHPVLRDSLLREAKLAGRLQAHHRVCADVLSAAKTPRAWRTEERLGRHLYAAGEKYEALQHLSGAANAWSRAGAFRESLALCSMVEEILQELKAPSDDPRHVQLVQLRLTCHQSRGDYTAARRWCQRAIDMADSVVSIEARADLLLDVATFHYAHHEYKRCAAALNRARDLLHDPPDPLALKVAITQSRLAVSDADWPNAEQHLSRALDLADTLNDLPAVGGVLRDLGSVAFLRGAVTQASRKYERARLVLLEGGGLGDLASVLNNLGECARVLGDFKAAEQYYRESAALFDRAGASAAAQYPYINLGLLLTRAGRHADALVPLTHALDELSTEASRSFEAIVRVLLVPCCAALQDWAGLSLQLDRLQKADDKMPELEPELADCLVEAAQTCIEERHVAEAARCYALAAKLYLQMERPDAAQTCLDTKERLGVDPTPSGEHLIADT